MRRLALALALALLVLLAACHRTRPVSLRDRVRNLVAAARPIAVKVDVKAVLDHATAAATDRAIDQAADRAARRSRRPAPAERPVDSPAPRPEPQPDVPVQIDRVDASKPTGFVMRWQTRGGKASCEVHATKDECTRACTSLLQSHALEKPGDHTPQGCTCLEQDGGC